MASDQFTAGRVQAFLPPRPPVSNLALFFGLAGAPLVWALLSLTNYAVNAHFCYPDGAPHSSAPPELGWVWGVLWGMAGFALVIALAATLTSFLNWRGIGRAAEERVIEGEPTLGRIRFLSIWGMITGTAFTLAILFHIIALIGMPLCF